MVVAEKKILLGIGGHPDDVDQFGGGTLKLAKEAGHETFIGVVSNGECGSNILPAQEIVNIRKLESKAAADALGAELIMLDGIPDQGVEADMELKRKLTWLIREVNPNGILTHLESDWRFSSDHGAVGRAVVGAIAAARLTNFISTPTHSRREERPHLYQWDHQGMVDGTGNFIPMNTVVDITSVIDAKLEALKLHRSQVEGNSVIETTRNWAAAAAIQVREPGNPVKYAERYRKELSYDNPKWPLLYRMLPGRVYPMGG